MQKKDECVMTMASSVKAEEINSHTYIVRITVPGFTYLPGQYIKVSSGNGLERYFSVSSWNNPVNCDESDVVEILIKFSEFLSASHRIILDIISGKEIFISQPRGLAYWRQSSYGNVLIACDSGYGYVRGIIKYIADNHGKQPTMLISITENGYACFDAQYLNDLSRRNSNFRFISIDEAYSKRGGVFIRKVIQNIHESHFARSNFYIGSGNNFFQLFKNELDSLGVNNTRIISDNN